MTTTNMNTKSKTTLNSGGGMGFGALTVKSNRGNLSPFKADKQMLNTEMTKMNKDELRGNFTNLVGNLPAIQRKQLKPKVAPPPVSQTHKKIKRKASIPANKAARLTQSVGPTTINNTEISTMVDGTNYAPGTTHMSVTKGTQSTTNSAYPSYFYTPKDNIFEKKRDSRYSKGQPKAFNLTQPDSNLAKFIFANQERSKRGGESQSMVNAYSPPPNALNSNGSIMNKSPRSHMAINTGAAANRGMLQSQHSIDSDNTIQAFLLKDSCG